MAQDVNTPRKNFFISYTKADRQWAEWIAWQLDKAGFSLVIQAWDFGPGTNFVWEMHKATKETEHTIVVLSPDYLTARFTQPEWGAAFRRDPLGEQRALLSVHVRKCKEEDLGLLGQIVYIDLVGLDEDTACKRLLQGVETTRQKPEEKPLFPGSANSMSPNNHPTEPGAEQVEEIDKVTENEQKLIQDKNADNP